MQTLQKRGKAAERLYMTGTHYMPSSAFEICNGFCADSLQAKIGMIFRFCMLLESCSYYQ